MKNYLKKSYATPSCFRQEETPTQKSKYFELFGKEFTPKDFEEIKDYNEDKNRKCFMCLRAYKKPFEELTEDDKYHITVCNPEILFECEIGQKAVKQRR